MEKLKKEDINHDGKLLYDVGQATTRAIAATQAKDQVSHTFGQHHQEGHTPWANTALHSKLQQAHKPRAC